MSGASPPSNGIGWVMGSSPDANGAGFHYGSKGRSAGASSLGRPKGASPSAGGGGPLVSPSPTTAAVCAVEEPVCPLWCSRMLMLADARQLEQPRQPRWQACRQPMQR